jgi:proline iminopeptidase
MVYIEPVGTTPENRLASHPDGYSAELYTSFMHSVINHLGIPEVYVLGHSFAGLIAANFALAEPKKTAGLVLYTTMATIGDEFGEEMALGLQKFIDEHSDAPRIDKMAEALGAGVGEDDYSASERFRTLLPAYFADYYGREEEFSPITENIKLSLVNCPEFGLRGSLENISVPTLVVAGRHDPVCGPRWAKELYENIPGAQLAMFEESGHLPHVEQPAEFAAAIAEFIR